MDNQTLIETLEALKDGGFVYNDADFCRKTGMAKSFLSEMKSGKRVITEQTVQRIRETFPDFFAPKVVRMETEVEHLLRIIEEHDVRFHELADRILDGMGVPRVKKEKAAAS